MALTRARSSTSDVAHAMLSNRPMRIGLLSALWLIAGMIVLASGTTEYIQGGGFRASQVRRGYSQPKMSIKLDAPTRRPLNSPAASLVLDAPVPLPQAVRTPSDQDKWDIVSNILGFGIGVFGAVFLSAVAAVALTVANTTFESLKQKNMEGQAMVQTLANNSRDGQSMVQTVQPKQDLAISAGFADSAATASGQSASVVQGESFLQMAGFGNNANAPLQSSNMSSLPVVPETILDTTQVQMNRPGKLWEVKLPTSMSVVQPLGNVSSRSSWQGSERTPSFGRDLSRVGQMEATCPYKNTMRALGFVRHQ